MRWLDLQCQTEVDIYVCNKDMVPVGYAIERPIIPPFRTSSGEVQILRFRNFSEYPYIRGHVSFDCS